MIPFLKKNKGDKKPPKSNVPRTAQESIDLARGRNGAEGMRWNKKRTVHCNGEHRGSKFALT